MCSRRFVPASLLCLALAAPAASQPSPGISEFLVPAYITGDQAQAEVAADELGNFVVVWTDSSRDGDGPGVFARLKLFDAEGTGTRRRGRPAGECRKVASKGSSGGRESRTPAP